MEIPERLDVRAAIQRADQNNIKVGVVLLAVVPAIAYAVGLGIQANSHDSFPTLVWVIIGLSILIGICLLFSALRSQWHPEKHQALQWPSLGSPSEVLRAIERSWNDTYTDEKQRFGDSYVCTPEWLLEIGSNTFNACPFRELIWAYYNVKSNYVNGLRTGTTRTIQLRFTKESDFTSISVSSDEQAEEVLFVLQRLAPWAYFGHTEANHGTWLRNRDAMIASVRERYALAIIEPLLPESIDPVQPPPPSAPPPIPAAQEKSPIVEQSPVPGWVAAMHPVEAQTSAEGTATGTLRNDNSAATSANEPRYIVMGKDLNKSRPLTKSDLFDRVAAGLITPDTKLQQVGQDTWFKAWDHPGLRSLLEIQGKGDSEKKVVVRTYLTPPFTATELGITDSIFAEYKRQYIQFSWVQLLGVPLILGGVGIGMILYAMFQKASLCRRIAELGGNADKFREHARWEFQKKALPVGIGIFSASAALLLFNIIGSMTWDKRASLRTNMMIARTLNEMNRRDRSRNSPTDADDATYGHLTMADVMRLHPSMTEEEVSRILGPLDDPTDATESTDQDQHIWTYHLNQGEVCTLIFHHRKLTTVEVVDKRGTVTFHQ